MNTAFPGDKSFLVSTYKPIISRVFDKLDTKTCFIYYSNVIMYKQPVL